MVYEGLVNVRTSHSGNIDLVGSDGKTFIATLGHGDEAKEIAQHIANLWNLDIEAKGKHLLHK